LIDDLRLMSFENSDRYLQLHRARPGKDIDETGLRATVP
jgi:hypothetical protein